MPKSLDFSYALRSFTGYLEGTQKAAHTIKNYRMDILSFQRFLTKQHPNKPVRLDALDLRDVEGFHNFLKSQGLKTNTRRRKLMTIRRFLNYLAGRNKVPSILGKKLPTPHKVERIPYTISSEDLLASIRQLPTDSPISARNRALLWTLAETGCLVSEVSRLRFDQWIKTGHVAVIQFTGKAPRTVVVSNELFQSVQDLKKYGRDRPWIFLGHNKFGDLGAPITPRGVELLVRAYASRITSEAVADHVTPRTFRHSVVVRWFREGKPRDEIQKLLGLKTPYAFRAYDPILRTIKSKSKTTSSSGTNPQGS